MESYLQDPNSFGIIKLIGFSLCFIAVGLFQRRFPYKRDQSLIVTNWKQNLPLATFNIGFMSLACASCVCLWSLYLQKNGYGLFNMYNLPSWLTLSATIFTLDGVAYIWHRMNHRYSGFWRFHLVHHTDQIFDASTAVRFHLGELLISLAVRFAVVALLGLSILEILIFELLFQFFNIFEHGNVRLPLGIERVMSRLFITPAMHRKHHSIVRDQLNSNYGTIFSFWDKLGGTYRSANSDEVITVGVTPPPGNRSFIDLLALPFSRTYFKQ